MTHFKSMLMTIDKKGEIFRCLLFLLSLQIQITYKKELDLCRSHVLTDPT